MSPVYIPTVREEWIKAMQQKPTPTPEDPEKPPSQPNEPPGPKSARKHTAKKSGAGHQRTGGKNDDKRDNSQSDPKDLQPLSMDPEYPLRPKPKPKGAGVKPGGPKPKNTAGATAKRGKPNEPVPKSTEGTVPGGQTAWYKTDVMYDLK